MNSSMWYAIHTCTVSLHLSVSFPGFSIKELSTTRANFRPLHFRPLSIRRKLLLWICGNFQQQRSSTLQNCRKRGTYAQIFGNFHFILIFLPDFQIFWKLSQEISEPLVPAWNFSELSGWTESALGLSKLLNQSNVCKVVTSFSVGFLNFSTNQTRARLSHLSVGFPNF